MAKQTLNLLFKKIQRDDKKDVLKFEIRSQNKDEKVKSPQAIQEMVGEMVNIEIDGMECGPVSAELAKATNVGKKVVLDMNLKGDNAEKAAALFLMAGTDVTLFIEPAQASLLEGEEAKQNDHEGLEYEVDLAGNVTNIKDKKKEKEESEEPETVAEDAKEVAENSLDDDNLPF